MNQDDIFQLKNEVSLEVKELDTKVDLDVVKEVTERRELEKTIPSDYIPVSIECSDGKLKAPKILHFKNFNLNDVIDVAKYKSSDNFYKAMMKVLKSLNYEDFDCSQFHINEIIEVLMKLYANFINTKIPNQQYLIDENKGWYDENVATVDILVEKLNIIKLPDSFKKEPFKVGAPNSKDIVYFELPKLEHLIIATEYSDIAIKSLKQRYSEIKDKINKIKELKLQIEQANKDIVITLKTIEKEKDTIVKQSFELKLNSLRNVVANNEIELESLVVTDEDRQFIDNTDTKKQLTFVEVYQRLCIHSINGKVLTLEEKLSSNLNIMYFLNYNSFIQTLKFGVDDEYEFYCPHNKKTIKRRFTFRIDDFIPTLQFTTDTGDYISFD